MKPPLHVLTDTGHYLIVSTRNLDVMKGDIAFFCEACIRRGLRYMGEAGQPEDKATNIFFEKLPGYDRATANIIEARDD